MFPAGRVKGRMGCGDGVVYPVIRHATEIRVGAKTCHGDAAVRGSADFRESGEREASEVFFGEGRAYSIALDVNLDGKVGNDDLAMVRARFGR